MASLAKITLRIAIIAIFFSQLQKPAFDIAIIIAAVANILSLLYSHQLKVHNRWFLLFLLYTGINLIFHLFSSSWSLLPILYYFRLSALLGFFIFPPAIDSNTKKLISLTLFSAVIFGLVQYLFWPNLTYFDSLNWDPHLNRIVGPFFDPTFTALLYLFLLIIFAINRNPLIILVYSALALTYSRASWLSLSAVSFITSIKTKKIYPFFLASIIIVVTIILLPKPYGEGTNLQRTSTILAKIENYKIAVSYIKSAPIFGYGYNRLPQVRTDQQITSHSSSAFDNSLLTIWATTGIFGLILFITGIIFQLQHHSWSQNLFWLSVLLHSLFANSLLYPPILFLLSLL